VLAAPMSGTSASAALICAASLLVGRAVLSLAGRREWSWLEPAVGVAAILTVTGALARAPGHSTTATLGLVALLVAAGLVCWRLPYEGGETLRQGLAVTLVAAIVLSIPFAISDRWGFLGVGFNNDLGPHLAWAESLRSGLGPAAEAGYPLGPHGLAAAVAAVPGIGLGQAFVGEVFALGVPTALTTHAELGGRSRTRRRLRGRGLRDRGADGAHHPGGARRARALATRARRDDGRGHLPRRLLLRPGRRQGDGGGAARPRLRAGPARPGPTRSRRLADAPLL